MTEEKLKPFTKWTGGKRQLLPILNELKPKDFNNYIEPFIGGGAMLFNLRPSKAIINDYNTELINLYRCVKSTPNELLERLEEHQTNNSKDYYYNIRSMDRDHRLEDLSNVGRAARILYMLKVDFNGLYRVNKKGQFNAPYGKYINPKIADHSGIQSISNFLNDSDITILQGDYTKAIKFAMKNDFVYLDPPYEPLTRSSSFTGYTDQGFNSDDQVALKKQIDLLTDNGIKVMMSNSSADLIYDLYKDYNIYTVDATRMINSNAQARGNVKEVIVTNY